MRTDLAIITLVCHTRCISGLTLFNRAVFTASLPFSSPVRKKPLHQRHHTYTRKDDTPEWRAGYKLKHTPAEQDTKQNNPYPQGSIELVF